MCLCNDGVVSANLAMENLTADCSSLNQNDLWMNTFYRTASIGFGAGSTFSHGFGAQASQTGFGNSQHQPNSTLGFGKKAEEKPSNNPPEKEEEKIPDTYQQ